MTEHNNKIDFSMVLASAVHDMKNSLCLLLQSIETLSATLADQADEANQLAAIHYEAARVNTGLMQLLSLYRSEMDELPLSIDEHYLEDIFDELLATNANYINNKKIQVDIDYDQDKAWYLDADLVNVLMNDMLVNAMRYSKGKISLKAFEDDGYLVLQIEDDGGGYPQSMLRTNHLEVQEFDIRTGRTGLGLFFARMIAQAHTQDDRKGSIHLANGGAYGGSVFTLRIP